MAKSFIGEKLKKVRKQMNLTQNEMVLDGKIISIGQYSKIENGVHDIDADTFFKILTAHPEIDSLDLIEEIQKYYANRYAKYSFKESCTQYLSDQLMFAFYDNDLNKVKKLKNKIDKIKAPKELQLRATITIAVLSGTLNQLNDGVRKEISYNAFKGKDWTKNRDSIRLFSNAMSVIDSTVLPNLMNSILTTYHDINEFPVKIQERISSVCINYLYISKHDSKNADLNTVYHVISYLETIADIPSLMFNKILGHYFYSWFNEDFEEVDNIQKILKLSHCDNFLDKLKE